MTDTHIKEITPDHLMDNFRGRSLKSIIVFTLVVHVVGLTATSTSYLWQLVAGDDSSKLSEEQRVELAVKEATSSLRGIAEKHGLKPQELSDKFASKAPKAPKDEAENTTPKPADGAAPAGDAPKAETPNAETPKAEAPEGVTPKEETPTVPDKPKSEIEKEISTKAEGPKMPAIEDEKEDLFK